MRITWERQDGWFDREYTVVDTDGTVVEKLGKHPSLDQLRETERQHGTRIQLWQAGLLCSACGNEITGRFGADRRGHLLCWDCASDDHGSEENSLSMNIDPTDVVISSSHLYKKSLCDYVINVATGCRHGCRFCYVPTTAGVRNREHILSEQAGVEDAQRDWGSYLLYRDDLPERLHNHLESINGDDWKYTERGRGVIMLSSGTDCYQDRRTAQITRACVQELVNQGYPVRILTRSPAVTRDLDLFKRAGDLVTVGSSIPSMDDEFVQALEPNAPPPSIRWQALKEVRQAGVPRYVSLSPTYPTMDEDEIRDVLASLKRLEPEVVFHEPINPRGANFQMCVEAAHEGGYRELAVELEALQDHQVWVEYALEQLNLVQQVADELGGLQIHSWPDRELMQSTSGELRFQLSNMRNAVSPERFSGDEPARAESQTVPEDDMDSIRSYIRN
jgi:DNA repair photolyase